MNLANHSITPVFIRSSLNQFWIHRTLSLSAVLYELNTKAEDLDWSFSWFGKLISKIQFHSFLSAVVEEIQGKGMGSKEICSFLWTSDDPRKLRLSSKVFEGALQAACLARATSLVAAILVQQVNGNKKET